MEERLHAYLGGTIRALGGVPIEINGMPDHVHLLAKLRQDKSLSDVLRDLKANSSGWVHDTFPTIRDFAWQGGYTAFTVSESKMETVRRYIRNQKGHHKTVDFQEELITLLRGNNIDFDERYLLR
jgi:hypothetical protein